MIELSPIQQLCIWILPLLFAITLHEAAHAWVAFRCGDPTAKMLGRLSFNPIKHLDIWGTIVIPLIVLLISHFQFAFGWAKPVPINARFFKKPRRDIVLVAAAGPVINLIMAVIWTAILKIAYHYHPQISIHALFFLLTAQAGMIINLLLAFLNLIPLPPLDGGRIAVALLPEPFASQLQKLEPYGFFILLALMLSGALAFLLNPIINGAMGFLLMLARL